MPEIVKVNNWFSLPVCAAGTVNTGASLLGVTVMSIVAKALSSEASFTRKVNESVPLKLPVGV